MNNYQIIFSQIHPLCVDLMKTEKQPSKASLIAYYEKLNEIFSKNKISKRDKENSNRLTEFLLLPVFSSLKHSTNLNLNYQEIVFNIFSCIIRNLNITNFDLFLQILNKCTFLVSNQLNMESSQQLYDEYFDAYMSLLRNLFENNTEIKLFYEYTQLTTLGLLISMLLDILTRSDTLGLRLNVIQTLSIVCNLNNEDLELVNEEKNKSTISMYLH